ncbi:MAG: ABC transporter permease [Crocinitomicaceae bacterium]
MKKIFIIARKEFLDLLRDKRTLIRMILIPLLVFPIIINLVTMVQSSASEKEAEKELEVGYVLNGQSSDMVDRMSKADHFIFTPYQDSAQLRQDVIDENVNMGISYYSNFDTAYATGEIAMFDVFMRGTNYEEYERLEDLIETEDSLLTARRMQTVGQDYNFITPFMAIPQNQSDKSEVLAKYAGGMLPYFFLAFCFMGCMIPAIDMFAGEKERGTIETLLTTPVKRIYIVLGKMIVVTTFGLLSASLALAGLYIGLNFLGIEGEFMDTVKGMLTPGLIATLYILLVPLAIFFAGIMIPISVYSKSFKEAQSILTPLNILVVLPAIFGFLPGVELDYTTAFIPILNVVLACKSLIGGHPEWALIAITFFSLIILAGAAVYISIKQFGKESNVLR